MVWISFSLRRVNNFVGIFPKYTNPIVGIVAGSQREYRNYSVTIGLYSPINRIICHIRLSVRPFFYVYAASRACSCGYVNSYGRKHFVILKLSTCTEASVSTVAFTFTNTKFSPDSSAVYRNRLPFERFYSSWRTHTVSLWYHIIPQKRMLGPRMKQGKDCSQTWTIPIFLKDPVLAQTQKTIRYKTLQGTI